MYAVIRTGGKQYRVETGEQLEVERLGAADGTDVELKPVLVVAGDTVLSTPSQLEGAVVRARVIAATRGPKIDGFIYKPKSNNRRRYGQPPVALPARDHRHRWRQGSAVGRAREGAGHDGREGNSGHGRTREGHQGHEGAREGHTGEGGSGEEGHQSEGDQGDDDQVDEQGGARQAGGAGQGHEEGHQGHQGDQADQADEGGLTGVEEEGRGVVAQRA